MNCIVLSYKELDITLNIKKNQNKSALLIQYTTDKVTSIYLFGIHRIIHLCLVLHAATIQKQPFHNTFIK